MKKVFKSLVLLILVISVATPLIFSVQGADRYTFDIGISAIEKLQQMKIIDGYKNGELHPEYYVTRAEFTKMLCKTFTENSLNGNLETFDDVDNNHWAKTFIETAVKSGWISGYDDNTFRPEKNIVYEEAIAIICRALGVSSKYDKYPDNYIATAIDCSLIDGVNSIIGEKITREHAAKIIINALEYNESLKNESDKDNNWGILTTTTSKSKYSGGSGGRAVSYSVMEEAEVMMDGDSDATYFINYDYMNTEEYVSEEENVFKNAVLSPLSTFSIDTDTASYSNLRRFITNGQKIPNGSIRTEELINYFDYKKPETDGKTPFAVNYTVSKCPWNEENKLVMITVAGEELSEYRPSNLVFLIDTSGSMYNYNKLPLVKQALSLLLEKLGEEDMISIVTYASGTRVALEPTKAIEKEKIINTIQSLRAHGSTAGASGINLAYEQAEKFKTDNGNNRIILCTDGDFNVGISSTGDLEKLITQKRDSGIYLSVLGFGMGNYKDNRMETLADKGNGNYAYIDNLKEAKKVLVDEMSQTIYTIAKDVKIQAEFNPEKVKEYRLIGYENRMLNTEDFENDKKDAGELGAGATVTVLYEIVCGKETDEKSPLKYQKSMTTGSDELMNVKIRYKLPDESESKSEEFQITDFENESLTNDFNFAAAVAELGMILNDSEYKGNSHLDSVVELARKGIGEDNFGLRCEFVQLADLLRYANNY